MITSGVHALLASAGWQYLLQFYTDHCAKHGHVATPDEVGATIHDAWTTRQRLSTQALGTGKTAQNLKPWPSPKKSAPKGKSMKVRVMKKAKKRAMKQAAMKTSTRSTAQSTAQALNENSIAQPKKSTKKGRGASTFKKQKKVRPSMKKVVNQRVMRKQCVMK